MIPPETSAGRRRFLRLLAASPLLSYAALPADWMKAVGIAQENAVISSVQEALNVFDFEAAAKKNLLPEHWAYLATGVDDDSTIRANREGFTRYQIRMRTLADFSKLDMSVDLFGVKWNTPIVIQRRAARHLAGSVEGWQRRSDPVRRGSGAATVAPPFSQTADYQGENGRTRHRFDVSRNLEEGHGRDGHRYSRTR